MSGACNFQRRRRSTRARTIHYTQQSAYPEYSEYCIHFVSCHPSRGWSLLLPKCNRIRYVLQHILGTPRLCDAFSNGPRARACMMTPPR